MFLSMSSTLTTRVDTALCSCAFWFFKRALVIGGQSHWEEWEVILWYPSTILGCLVLPCAGEGSVRAHPVCAELTSGSATPWGISVTPNPLTSPSAWKWRLQQLCTQQKEEWEFILNVPPDALGERFKSVLGQTSAFKKKHGVPNSQSVMLISPFSLQRSLRQQSRSVTLRLVARGAI